MNSVQDPLFDRPVFVVSAPRSGSTLLFQALALAPGVYTVGGESQRLIASFPHLNARARDYASDRLVAADAEPDVVNELRKRFRTALRDRDMSPVRVGRPVRMLEKTPKNSLRIPFLMEAFPEARFVFLYRDPREVLASMMEAWQSDRFKTYVRLPGWPLPHWSLVLTPGWRALAGKPLPEIVAGQWQSATEVLLDDLTALPPGRFQSVRHEQLVRDPASQIQRLCGALGLDWDRPLGGPMPLARDAASRQDPEQGREHQTAIDAVLPGLQATIRRAEQVVGAS